MLQVSATGADAFSRRKTQSKVYWSTVPKAKRDELEAAAAAAGTTVQINADGTAVLSAAVTGTLAAVYCYLMTLTYTLMFTYAAFTCVQHCVHKQVNSSWLYCKQPLLRIGDMDCCACDLSESCLQTAQVMQN